MLVNKSVPNLAGGVSQQAPTLRLINQCEQQENFRSSLVNGLYTRPPVKTQYESIGTDALFAKADRDNKDIYNLLICPTEIAIYNADGYSASPELSYDAVQYLQIPAGATPETAYKTLTLADYTFVLNRHITAKLIDDTSSAWTNQALVFIKGVTTATTWALTLDGKTRAVGYGSASVSTGAPHLYADGVQIKSDVSMSTTEIGKYLYTTNIFPDFDIQQNGAVLWIRKKDGSAFTIGFNDTRADQYANLVTNRIQKFSELPTRAPDGYVCRVLGDTASTADDYFVKFVAYTEGEFTHGNWQETVAPGIQTQIDKNTMPWVLVHDADGWIFKPFEWTERAAGEDETNPVPMFIDRTINNIFLYRNRLCLLASDVLCMSAAAEHDRWWNETAFTFNDSDPIYISASTDDVTELHDFGTMQESLILFGENGQFILQTPDTLSPKTAAVLPLSAETYSLHTGIINLGASIYFGYKSKHAYNLKELGISSVTGQKETNVLTAHTPNYIPHGDLIQLKGTTSCDTIVVRSSAEKNALWVYQYYISNGSRLQASWSKIVIEDAEIKGVFFREHVLWLYLRVNRQSYIATLDMEDVPVEEDTEYRLDFQTTLTADEPTTEWDIPLHLRSQNLKALYERETGIYTENPITQAESDYSTITLKYPTDSIIVGLKYTALYEFSTPFMTKGQQNSKQNITSGRWQLQRMILQYGLSGNFDVFVKPTYDKNAEGYKYTYTGRVAGMQTAILGSVPISEGECKIPLRGKNTDIRVIILSDSWLPCCFVTADWQGNYVTRVREI